ncbi:MAG: hypothetical protein H0T42_33480 [Deltaproteobacteria bacterium]|nr:hypothetical protein [Deltaproteobacteria bacterium]
MRTVSWVLLAAMSILPGCVVGEDPDEDAVAGDGLGEDDFTGTDDNGDGIGTLRARVCANGATTKGIDVSYHQGVINWNAVKAGGIEFAFIRVSDGANFRDPKFATNWAAAKSAGVIRGVYQFFRPTQNIQTQATILINAVGGTYQPGDLAPVIDVEADGGLAPATVASRVKQLFDLVKAGTGIAPIIYTGKYFWRDEVGGSRTFSDSPLWIAQYTNQCPDLPSPWTRWTFWQHTDRGRISGINANVDLNKFNGTLAQLQALASGSSDPVITNRADALPFTWRPNFDGTVSFLATPPDNVVRVEFRIEDYLIGAASPAGGQAMLDYTWNVERAGRPIEVRGLDANGATVAVGNGVIDSTAPPKVFVNQVGTLEYEIGVESLAGVTSTEVTADGFPLTDSVSGRARSERGMVRFKFTQSGERALRIVSRNASNTIVGTESRTLHVR